MPLLVAYSIKQDLISDFIFDFTAAGVVPYINHSAVYILFWSFEISDNIF